MKIIRIPKEKPPSDIHTKDLDTATKNGVVDLLKIKNAKKLRKEERIRKTAAMRKTLAKKRSVAKFFTDIYSLSVGGKYDLRPTRYVQRKVKNKNVYKRTTINSDLDRLWNIFYYINTRYNCGINEYKEYLEFIFEEVMDKVTFSKNSIIGYIENKDRIDSYFFKLKKDLAISNKASCVRERSKANSKYFN